MRSMRSLASVFALLGFVLTVLSVVSMTLYMGSLRQKCVKWPVSGNLSDYDYAGNLTDTHYDYFDFHSHVNDLGRMTMSKTMKQNELLVLLFYWLSQ